MSAALQQPVLDGEPLGAAVCLRSPLSGARLHHDGPHSLAAPGERWPILDGIAYLRTDRAELIAAALRLIDAGDPAAATAVLLRDRVDGGAAPPGGDLAELVRRCGALGLREAMRALGLGYEAEIIAHRWSDPTLLSGLALAEAYWRPVPRLLDVGCGSGHALRAASRLAGTAWGGDRAFAPLWLARHFVAPGAALVCFDAETAWPFEDAAFDMVLCHDVLHLLADPAAAVAEMRRVAGDGLMLCGHIRLAGVQPNPAQAARSAQDWARLLEAGSLFDDAELTSALVACRAPRPLPASALGRARAIAIAAGRESGQPPHAVLGALSTPPRGAALRRNPLYCEEADGSCVRRFPSARYAEEVGQFVTYPAHVAARGRVTAGADPADDALIRRRVWVDLPARW